MRKLTLTYCRNKALVLVNIAKNEDTLKFEKQPEISIADSIKEGESLVYSKKISFADLLDPTIYFQHKFGKDSLKLVINNEKRFNFMKNEMNA